MADLLSSVRRWAGEMVSGRPSAPTEQAPTQPDALAVRWPATGYDLSGLVPIYWQAASSVPAGTTLKLACREHSATIPLEEQTAERWFALHSHLLPNGESTLSLKLVDPAGRLLDEKSHQLKVGNHGPIAEQVRASMRAKSTPFLVTRGCDSSLYDYADPKLTAWFDRPDALDTIRAWEAAGTISSEEAHHLRDFVTKGFIVVPNLVEPDLVGRVNGEIDQAIASGYQNYEYGSSQRIEKLHEHYPAIRELWLHKGVMHLLRLLFQTTPRPCQTLTYVFGSEQEAHQDTIP